MSPRVRAGRNARVCVAALAPGPSQKRIEPPPERAAPSVTAAASTAVACVSTVYPRFINGHAVRPALERLPAQSQRALPSAAVGASVQPRGYSATPAAGYPPYLPAVPPPVRPYYQHQYHANAATVATGESQPPPYSTHPNTASCLPNISCH